MVKHGYGWQWGNAVSAVHNDPELANEAGHYALFGAEVGGVIGTAAVAFYYLPGSSAATWLASHHVVEGGLIGGESEWLRQFASNLSDGMDVTQAGYYKNFDYWQIAESAGFGALTAGIWKGAGVFNPRTDLSIRAATSNLAAATFWSGIAGGAGYLGTTAFLDSADLHKILKDVNFADILSNVAFGSIEGAVSTQIFDFFGPQEAALKATISNHALRAFGYGSAGIITGFIQAEADYALNTLDSSQQTPPIGACDIQSVFVGGAFNLTSFIPWALPSVTASVSTGIGSGVLDNKCRKG